MSNPTETSLKRPFLITLALFVPCAISIAWADLAIRTAAAPSGIVSYELCYFANSCQTILDSWDDSMKLHAMYSLGSDYLFMLLYPALIAIALLSIARQLAGGLQTFLRGLAYASVLMSITDAIENYALIQMMLGADIATMAPIASGFASAKFLVLALCAAGLIYGHLAKALGKKQ